MDFQPELATQNVAADDILTARGNTPLVIDPSQLTANDTDASGEECAMPAWVHGEWRLLRALISHAAGSRPEAYALPKQIDAEGQ